MSYNVDYFNKSHLKCERFVNKIIGDIYAMVYNTADSDIQMQSGFGKGYINV